MKLNKLLSAVLCLCLCCAAIPALAAPARDIQTMDVIVDQGMQTLVNIAVAAIPEECFGDAPVTVLAADEAPSPALTEQALAAAAFYARPTTFLAGDEAEALFHQIFTNGEMKLAPEEELVFLAAKENGLEARPEVFNAAGCGAYIYSAAFDGTDVAVLCDLYTFSFPGFVDYQALEVDTLPEDAVTWECNVALSLRFNPEAEFGYTVNSLAVSPIYLNGAVALWQAVDCTQFEYSVNLPSILGLAEDDPAHRSWQTADGAASLTIDVAEESVSFDVALSRFMQAHPGLAVQQERDFGYFYALNEGEYNLVFASEDLNWSYALTLLFPAERQAEFALYAEFIRNSMIVWGLSNG